MSDYISKSVLLEKIDDLPRDYGRLDDSDVLDEIERAPTVDAVPVVRCGECKFSKPRLFLPGEDRLLCENQKSPCCFRFTPDGWGCMAGERKDGEK